MANGTARDSEVDSCMSTRRGNQGDPVMSIYDDPIFVEIYEAHVTDENDVSLIRQLVGKETPLRILEPFCGTGRILVPLAKDGHFLYGFDSSGHMLEQARKKVAQLPQEVAARITLDSRDAVRESWGTGYDVVIMARSALLEVDSVENQEACVRKATEVLVPRGKLFMDFAQKDIHAIVPGQSGVIISSTTPAGWYAENGSTVLEVDIAQRDIFYGRYWLTRNPGGKEHRIGYRHREHVPTADEVRHWLKTGRYDIVSMFGDRDGAPWSPEAERSIIWAQKQ